ncbi:hypothetical protein GBAR_LOCUS11534, partial [Geodia barretti]
MRLNTRRRTTVATATGSLRYTRNDKMGTHKNPSAIWAHRRGRARNPGCSPRKCRRCRARHTA